MKKFLNKVWNFLKKFPVMVTLIIVIPITIFSGRYLFSTEYIYYNLFYEGEHLQADPDTFRLTGIKKIANMYQGGSGFSYQGGAGYENYYAVCADCFETIIIYDVETMKVEHNIPTGTLETTWHCNQMFFGPNFYTSSDKFPLLYVSMEHKDVMATMVFRIYQNGANYKVDLVQTLHLYCKEDEPLYFPNSYYDFDTDLIWYGGYTKNSYMKSDDNFLKFYAFNLPDYRLTDEWLMVQEAEDSMTLPSETATQGGFISGGRLYQTFSFDKKDDPLRAPKMRVVDLSEKKITLDYQNLGEKFGVYKEFEHVAICNNGKMYSVGNPFEIYEFEFTSDASDDLMDDEIE